jgi:hypothetical protein
VVCERDRELEEFLDSLPATIRDVFKYMRREYECITNYGENYNPEKHDPVVAELASKRFGIKPKEAAQIYVNVQIMIGEFHIKRLEKELVIN